MPQDWDRRQIITVLKKGYQKIYNNYDYGLITLLNAVDKIMATLI